MDEFLIRYDQTKSGWRIGRPDQSVRVPGNIITAKFSEKSMPHNIPVAGVDGRLDPGWFRRSNYWEENVARVPVAVHAHDCCAYNGKIYLFGGSVNEYVYEYNPESNMWRSTGKMPEKVWHHRVIGHKGSAYIISGHMGNNKETEYMRRYDLPTEEIPEGKWSVLSPIPFPVYHPASAKWENKIYSIGGYSSKEKTGLKKLQIYDLEKDSWQIKEVHEALYHWDAVAYNGKIYACGGHPGSYPNSKKLFIYDIETDSWTEGNGLSTARSAHNCVLIGQKMYVFMGYEQPYGLSSVEIYDIEKDSWSFGNPAPYACWYSCAVLMQGKVYLMGGYISSGNFWRCSVYTP